MTLADFTETIPKNILKRGREYEENGQVTGLRKKQYHPHAVSRSGEGNKALRGSGAGG